VDGELAAEWRGENPLDWPLSAHQQSRSDCAPYYRLETAMRMTRTVFSLTTLAIGIAAAACSSSKATGPSAAKQAATFDSLYKVDSQAQSARTAFDVLALIPADEGATSTPVSVTTDGGAISMDMTGLVLYDTAGGAVSDSSILLFAWTSDYGTTLLTIASGMVGPDIVPRHRLGVSSERLAGIRALANRLPPGGRVSARGVPSSFAALLFQGPAVATADTATVIASDAPGNGSCKFEGDSLREGEQLTATSACTIVTVTEAFTLHFPATAGISATLTHLSLPSSKTVPGVRLAITG
jgi:hypothetical protein